ncbi:hypothetical protein EVAR_86327_1 [Eumeta japonica]|uniref:Uncharacterized protein n=1 Tax=Eumeta variegata TaxID=151549 RepID=A0A4C1X7E7_EUMVA|nr:hypothetical protein EVAR_86327_1 [Eumeta japonica]
MVGHTISYLPDDFDGSLPTDYFEEFSYKSDLPVFISPINYIGVHDPLTEILRIKKKWNDELGCLFKRPDALLKKYEKINEEVVKCPQRLIDAAICLEKEPEQNFSSDYNCTQKICLDVRTAKKQVKALPDRNQHRHNNKYNRTKNFNNLPPKPAGRRGEVDHHLPTNLPSKPNTK